MEGNRDALDAVRRCSTIFNDNWRRIDESFTENISTILRWIAVGQASPRIAGNRILLYAIGYVWINYPAAYGIARFER